MAWLAVLVALLAVALAARGVSAFAPLGPAENALAYWAPNAAGHANAGTQSSPVSAAGASWLYGAANSGAVTTAGTNLTGQGSAASQLALWVDASNVLYSSGWTDSTGYQVSIHNRLDFLASLSGCLDDCVFSFRWTGYGTGTPPTFDLEVEGDGSWGPFQFRQAIQPETGVVTTVTSEGAWSPVGENLVHWTNKPNVHFRLTFRAPSSSPDYQVAITDIQLVGLAPTVPSSGGSPSESPGGSPSPSPAPAAGGSIPTEADCDRSIPHCKSCKYQVYRGATTKAVCTMCRAGYAVRASGRGCYCAPGYYTTNDTSVAGFTCQPCGDGFYCPGAKVTAESSTARYSCGKNKITMGGGYAKSDRECVAPPGYGWGEGDATAVCPVGYYNPGYNSRACSKCPGGLSTDGSASTSSTDCQSPPGMYYVRGKAVACARGTYKATIGNKDCDKCPEGVLTPDNTVGIDNKTLCNVLMPGYSMVAKPVLGITDGVECGMSSYRAGETKTPLSPDGPAIPCTPCGNNLVTLPNTTRATTPDACLAPPGWGWSVDSIGANPAGKATICPRGWYNPGYNREACIKCDGYNGTITTLAEGAKSADECYVPAGHGTSRDAVTKLLTGFKCPINTYGRINNTFGLVDVECTKCLDNTHTVAEGAVGASQCVTNPGYGYDDGQVNQCDFGYWSAGGDQAPCTYCGTFLNTSAADGAKAADMGATSRDQCRVDLGYQRSGANGTIVACLRGYYKDTIGTATCQQCPPATTTTYMRAATRTADCDACRPGFGIDSGAIDLATPACAICKSGTYSPGYFSGGQKCVACPKTANFTGRMVSREGVSTPEDCFGEFVTDAGVDKNYLGYDYIPMAEGPSYALQSGITTSKDCQDACSASPQCSYFTFKAADGQCFHRVGSLARVATGDWDAPTVPIVAFEARARQFAAYSKAAGEIVGTTLRTSIATLASAVDACNAAADCIGLTHDGDGTGWRLFGGSLGFEVVGKVRVVGENIMPWVAGPTGTESPAL